MGRTNRNSKGKKGKGKKKKFVYRAPKAETIKSRSQQQGGMYDSYVKTPFQSFVPKDGDNRVRILPATDEDMDHYGLDIHLHRQVGSDNQTYLCLNKMLNKKCPVCEEIKRLGADSEDGREIKASRRVMVWIIDRDNEQDGPKLWAMPWTVDRDITSVSIDKDTNETLYIDHPDEGFDVLFSKTGKGINTKYIGVAVNRRSTPISREEDEQEAWLELISQNPVPTTLNYFEYEHIESVLCGDVDSSDDDDDDEAPKTRSKRSKGDKSKRRKKKEEVDDDDEDDEDLEDEDGDEEDEEDGDDDDNGSDNGDDDDEDDDDDGDGDDDDGEDGDDDDEDGDDDDDEDLEDDDDDEPEPPKKSKRRSGKASKGKGKSATKDKGKKRKRQRA